METAAFGYIIMALIGGMLGLWLIYLVIGPRKGK